jgi:hypothetical protein
MADQSPPATPLKAHLSQFESIDKHVDHANRVALDNEIISGHLPSRRACLDRTKNRPCGNGRFPSKVELSIGCVYRKPYPS